MSRILMLADDSQTIQKVVELILVPEGFDVVSYGNGEDALDALDTITPDIILADIEMPKLNGYQLCEKVRYNPHTGHIPVILLAGAFEPFDEDRLKAVGADDFILKPFEPYELVSKVKSLLVKNDSEGIQYPAEEEKLKALGKEQTDGQSPGPEALSIEEISRMVKEAVGMPTALKAEVKASPPVKQPASEGPQMPDTRTLESIIRTSVQDLAGSLKKGIEEAIRRQVADTLPGIFEEQLRKTVGEMSGKMQNIAEAEMKKAIPEIAERIIKREIEKITSELS